MTDIDDKIKRLADEQRKLWETEGKPLADIAETREFTADERQKYEALNERYNSYDDRIGLLVRQREQNKRNDEWADQIADSADIRKGRADEIRAVLRGEQRLVDFTPTAEEVRGMNRGLPSSVLATLPPAALRALGIGTATAGGNTVGASFLSQLIEPLRMFSGVQAAGAFQLVTSTGSNLTVPRLSSFGAAAAQSEATQLTGTDPAFDQVTFHTYKYGDFRGISNELIEDSLVDIESIVVQLMGENIAVDLGADLATGAGGSDAPTGVTKAATVGVTGSDASGKITFDELIDLQESVLAPYQVKASWVASNGAVGAARKLKDSQGRYLWQPNGQAGAPAELLGNPVHRDPFFAAPAADAVSWAYGDFTRYWVRVVGEVRVESSPHALFGTDQTAFRAVLRADGQLMDPNAVKTFKGKAAA